MSTRIRYGIIGCGSMGREHIENIKAIDGTEITAIADTHAQSLQAARALLAGPVQTFEDYRELLAGAAFDALVISTPNHTHITVLRDALRPIEIHEMQGSIHAQGFMMVWLPSEKLLIQADAYTPGPPNSPAPPAPNPNHVNLVANIDRLGLAPDRILPLHSRVATMAELNAQIGRK